MKRVPLRKQVKLFERFRRQRIAALLAEGHIRSEGEVPDDAIPADMKLQAPANTYSPKTYYVDLPFRCFDCAKDEVWSAEDQMHWYETLKGTIHSGPKRCRACRKSERDRKAEHRARSLAGAEKKRANKAAEPTTMAATTRAPSSVARPSHGPGSP